MAIYYSPGEKGFYVDGIHDSIPEDKIEITELEHARLIEGQALGQRIVPGDDGYPELADNEAVEYTYAEKRAMEYPAFTDYLDGIVKGDEAQIQKYIDDCLAVKAKYPKE